MSKRISEEARVMDFFETADKVKVETVFNLVQGTMKRRFPKVADAAPKVRKARKPRNSSTAAPEGTKTHAGTAQDAAA